MYAKKNRLIDDRMGGEPLYYLSQPKGILMRISDVVRRCVAFVGIHEDNGIRWGGTVFFVNVLEDGLTFYYMVTAKACCRRIGWQRLCHTSEQQTRPHRDVGGELNEMVASSDGK
jgi:hypothetical protein